MTTNATFVAAIQAMTVTGVDRHYDYPPASADLSSGECAFLALPDAQMGERVSTCIGLSKTRSIGYVILIDATGQGTQEQNFAKLPALMDNLETALDALDFNFITYDITTNGNYPLGDSEYWAIVANITQSDA